MNLATLLPILLGSTVIVAMFETIKAAIGKWRPRTAIEDERSAKAFGEMKQVAEAYKEIVAVHKQAADDASTALANVKKELELAQKDVASLRLEVHTLEVSLADSAEMISKLMALVAAK